MKKRFAAGLINDQTELERRLEGIKNKSKWNKKGSIKFEGKGLSFVYKALEDIFNVIFVESARHPYLYILTVTKFGEQFGKVAKASAIQILDDYKEKRIKTEKSKGIAFTALYYAGLVYYRNDEKEKLRELLREYGSYFDDDKVLKIYLHELYSRYCGMNGDSKKQLLFVGIISDESRAAGIKEKNIALNAIYAAAVCNIAEYCFYRRDIYVKESLQSEPDEKDEVGNVKEFCESILNDEAEAYTYNHGNLAGDKLNIAIGKMDEAITFNPGYQKYYFLKAQLLFYGALYNDNILKPDEKREALEQLDKAEDIVNSWGNKNGENLLKGYKRFRMTVNGCLTGTEDWANVKEFYYEAAKRKIVQSTENNMNIKPDGYDKDTKAPYVFVSYSSKDYKAVYCDIIELRKNGVYCDYDNRMNFDGTGSRKNFNQAWYDAVEKKIEGAECVLCYLSENYIASGFVYEELEMIKKLGKRVITIGLNDCTRVTDLIIKMSDDKDYCNNMTSKKMAMHCEMFDDDTNKIARNKEPLDSSHIEYVIGRIFELSGIKGIATSGEHDERTGRKTLHPMEDYLVCDDVYKVYVVADGITRGNRNEYLIYGGSIAYEIAKTFSDNFVKAFSGGAFNVNSSKDEESLFKSSFETANGSVDGLATNYCAGKGIGFFERPGCVAAVVAVYRDYLYFASVGDCMCILVRNGKKIILSDKQTTYAFRKADMEKYRADLEGAYVNNVDNPYGYGVVNGQKGAEKFFKVSHIKLEFLDSIYLMTDGVSDYVQYCDPEIYEKLSVKEIIDEAIKCEENLHGKDCKHDDMALIRIRWDGVKSEKEIFKTENEQENVEVKEEAKEEETTESKGKVA